MACKFGILIQPTIATGTALKTLLQLIAPSDQDVALRELGISFAGVDATDAPILVQLMLQTTAGTMTSLTVLHTDRRLTSNFRTTAQHTATAEPTASTVLRSWYVHPQCGLIVPFRDDAPLIVLAGTRLGLTVTAADGVNCQPHLIFEE